MTFAIRMIHGCIQKCPNKQIPVVMTHKWPPNSGRSKTFPNKYKKKKNKKLILRINDLRDNILIYLVVF